MAEERPGLVHPRRDAFIMTDTLVREYVEIHVRADQERLISDSELRTLMRPSPLRAPDAVAVRARLLALEPHPATPRAYRVWPILISLTPAAAYLIAAGVLR